MTFAGSDDTMEVYINSQHDKLETDTLSNFTVRFSSSIQIPNGRTLKLAVKNWSVPNTMAQFAEDERKITVLQEDETQASLTIPSDRVFNSTADFITYLGTQLNTLTNVDVTLVQDTNTRKLSFTNNSVGKYIRLIASPFWKKMGFSASTGYTEIAGEATVLSNKLPVLIRTQRVYLCCPNVFYNAKTKDTNFSEIIATLDLEAGYGSFNSEEANYLYYHGLTNKNNIDSLRFYLMDDKRRRISDLEGGSVNISLILQLE